MAMVCCEAVPVCMDIMTGLAAHYDATASARVSVARHYFGTEDMPVQFKIVIIPPRGE